MVAGSGDIQDGRRDGGLAGGVRECAGTAFEGREALLEDVRRRVHDAGVDITELLQAEEIRGMLRVTELVARGLIDRDSARTGGRVGLLTGVQGLGA